MEWGKNMDDLKLDQQQADDMALYNQLQMYRRYIEKICDNEPTKEKFDKFLEDIDKGIIVPPQTFIKLNGESK